MITKENANGILKETAKAAVEHIKKTGRSVKPGAHAQLRTTPCPRLFTGTLPGSGKLQHWQEPYRKVVIRLKR